MRLVSFGLKSLAAIAFTGIALGASVASAASARPDGYHNGPVMERVAYRTPPRHRHHHHHRRHAMSRR